MKHYRRLLTVLYALTLTIMLVSTSNANKVIQTQYGPDGVEVDLIRAKSSGKYLTLVFNFRATGEENAHVLTNHKAVNFVDESGAKKYHVLKDSKGDYLASQGDKAGQRPAIRIEAGKSKIMWYKFPLPPENVKTINIQLPEISPFDAVEIER